MAEDFAVLDFALVAMAPREVACALARAEAAPARAGARSGGLLGRLIGRGKAAASGSAMPLLVQPRGTLPRGVLAREMLDDMGFGGTDHEARLSAPVGREGLTLVELRERTDGAPSPRLAALSRALGEVDVLAFRLSGGRHPAGEFAFVVFRNGAVTRSLRIRRSSEGADWQAETTGSPHPLEAEAPPETTRPGALIPPSRQAALLERMGIDADQLLVDRSAHARVLELSTRPGGTPPDALPEPHPAAAETPAEDTAWEDEVTQLLVSAVTDALAEEDQVPWLDAMTADLEAGRTEAAFDRARALLARGTRPQAIRAADTTRLARLFGVER